MNELTTTRVVFPLAWHERTLLDLSTEAIAKDVERESATMAAAMLVCYIHDMFFVGPDRKRPPRHQEAEYESFKDWCESHDRTEKWGNYMVNGARHAARVQNPYQARPLAGLSEKDADAVTETAKESGPLTGERIMAARKEFEKSRDTETKRIRKAAREVTESVELRKIATALKKAMTAGQRHGGMPEKFFADLEKWISWASEQSSLAA